MKRGRGLLLLLSVILGICASFRMQAAHAAGLSRTMEGWVQDDASLLTDEEEQKLAQECERIFEKHRIGIFVVTTEDFGSGDIKTWQRKIFNAYEFDAACKGNGVMLAVSMAGRDWGLTAFGTAQDAFSAYGRERIGERILDKLSEEEFYDAFSEFLSLAEDFLEEAEAGRPYTEQHKYGEGWRIPVIIAGAFVLSLVLSLTLVLSWRKSMNTRVRQNGAMAYFKEESFHLHSQEDQFLYHSVSRTKRQKQSSIGVEMHSDRSGTSGKF